MERQSYKLRVTSDYLQKNLTGLCSRPALHTKMLFVHASWVLLLHHCSEYAESFNCVTLSQTVNSPQNASLIRSRPRKLFVNLSTFHCIKISPFVLVAVGTMSPRLFSVQSCNSTTGRDVTASISTSIGLVSSVKNKNMKKRLNIYERLPGKSSSCTNTQQCF